MHSTEETTTTKQNLCNEKELIKWKNETCTSVTTNESIKKNEENVATEYCIL